MILSAVDIDRLAEYACELDPSMTPKYARSFAKALMERLVPSQEEFDKMANAMIPRLLACHYEDILAEHMAFQLLKDVQEHA